MIDDRVTRRNGRTRARRTTDAEREIESRAFAKEAARPRRTAQNKPERRRNFRFKESLG
jgi:hypothetical protein